MKEKSTMENSVLENKHRILISNISLNVGCGKKKKSVLKILEALGFYIF